MSVGIPGSLWYGDLESLMMCPEVVQLGHRVG